MLPPTVIFREETLNEDLMQGAVEGILFGHSKKGFIDEFYQLWFERFIASVPPARPLLLFMDGHVSHVNISILRKVRANDIHIIIFPAHLTHIFQPLDLSNFFPLKVLFWTRMRQVNAEEQI